MPTIEEMNATIDEASERAVKAMLENNPTAVEVLAGLRLLKARVGDGGDFKFWVAEDNGNRVIIKTTLPTFPDNTLSLIVYTNGAINVNYGRDHKGEYPVSDEPSGNVVLEALSLVTMRLTRLGQLAPPPAPSPKPQMEMSPLAACLVEEFKSIKAWSGDGFNYTKPFVDDFGNTWLTATFNKASGESHVDIVVDATKGTVMLDAKEEVGLPVSGGWKPSDGAIARKAATRVEQRLESKTL